MGRYIMSKSSKKFWDNPSFAQQPAKEQLRILTFSLVTVIIFFAIVAALFLLFLFSMGPGDTIPLHIAFFIGIAIFVYGLYLLAGMFIDTRVKRADVIRRIAKENSETHETQH